MRTLIQPIFSALFLLLLSLPLFSQTDSSGVTATHKYPEIKAYVDIVHPIYTWSKDGNHANFDDSYVVGNPWGINIWKNKKFGFTFEFTPTIKFTNSGSKMTNFLFHPGVLYRIGHEFTLIGRVAYETSGRYGFTPILNKVVYRSKANTIFIAALLPIRFGNALAPSYTAAFQFGLGF